MLILAIDTSHKDGSLTLARSTEDKTHVIETVAVDGGTFSAQLVPRLAALLQAHNIRKDQLEGIAAATGPGSFTGLRIGLAAVKGLAEAMQIPLAGVSTLHVVAASVGQGETIFAALDAGRGEIYTGEYRRHGGDVTCVREFLASATEFIVELSKHKTPVVAASPDEKLVKLASAAGVMSVQVPWPGSAAVARLGLKQLLAGHSLTVDELDANYLRRDDRLFERR